MSYQVLWKKNVFTLPYMGITVEESYKYVYVLFSTWISHRKRRQIHLSPNLSLPREPAKDAKMMEQTTTIGLWIAFLLIRLKSFGEIKKQHQVVNS